MQNKNNFSEKTYELGKVLRYNLSSSCRQIILRIEAARRQFEESYRHTTKQKNNYPESFLRIMGWIIFINILIIITISIILFFNYLLEVIPITTFSNDLKNILKIIYEKINIFPFIYEKINYILHFFGELVILFIKWISSIHLTENSDRIIIPNPLY